MHKLVITLATTSVLALSASGASYAHEGSDHDRTGALPAGTRAALAHAKNALKDYRDPAYAVAHGYLPTDTCFGLADGSAAMGYHYFNPDYFFGEPDPMRPPVLVYVPTADGGRTLGALEWAGIDADQDLETDEDRPSVLGIPFDGPMVGHEEGEPIHYDLHAWLFTPNPAGLLAPYNPAVHC